MSSVKKFKLPPKLKRVLLAIAFTARDIVILIAATYGFDILYDRIAESVGYSNAVFVSVGILLPTLCSLIIFATDKRRRQYLGKIIATHIVFAAGSFAYFGYTLLMTGENFYGIDNQLMDSLFLYLLMRILFAPAKNESAAPATPAKTEAAMPSADMVSLNNA